MKHDSLRAEFVEFVPDPLEQGILYVSEKYWVAIHLCACGCGGKTVTPLGEPQGWKYTREGDLVSLSPSIGNFQMPCHSHYFLERNQIRWV